MNNNLTPFIMLDFYNRFETFCNINNLDNEMTAVKNDETTSFSIGGEQRDIVLWDCDGEFEVREIKNKCTYLWTTDNFEEALMIVFGMFNKTKKVLI